MSPSLPPLYFSSLTVTTTTATNATVDSSTRVSLELPSELVHKCLAAYADWGDLAKLACVQKSWCNILEDACAVECEETASSSTWELARALLDGTHGLEANPTRGIRVLHQLTGMEEPPKDVSKVADITNDNSENDSTDNDSSTVSTNDHDNDHDNDNKKVGYAPAMKELASCYWLGRGVPADAARGLSWMQAAHHVAGDMDAAYQVAMVFEYGRHNVEIDVVAAANWFAAAAKAGHTEAMAELALCYELGCGVEQSDELALEWYMNAANQGHVTALFSVAEIFEEARGVPQSDEEACLWYYKAALEGDEDSRQALLRLQDIARIILPGVGRLLLHA